jgi:hypothetical protein
MGTGFDSDGSSQVCCLSTAELHTQTNSWRYSMSVVILRRLKLLYIKTCIFNSYLTENNVFPSERAISEIFLGKNIAVYCGNHTKHINTM